MVTWYPAVMFAARPATDEDLEPILTMMEDFNAIEAIAFDRAAFAPRLRTLLGDRALGGVLLFTVDGAPAGYAVVTWGWGPRLAGRRGVLPDLHRLLGR